MLDGHTKLIAHVGDPTAAFKAPLIYNPYFAHIGLNAIVVPMGVRAEDFPVSFPAIARLSNFHGALITMPHKITVVGLLARASTAVAIAGSCNAVRLGGDGRLEGDMFDGEGFVRGLERKGFRIGGASALVIGAGGVGSAIAASLAGRGLARIALHDPDRATEAGLAARLTRHHSGLAITTGSNDPAGFDLVVNASPLGMVADDPLPVDPARLDPGCFAADVVMSRLVTPFLAAARERGCRIQAGLDMLFEMIPAYLEFFGFPTTTPETLRRLSALDSDT